MMAGGNGFKVKDRRTFINPDDDSPEALDEGSSEPEETSSDKPTYIQQLEDRTRQASLLGLDPENLHIHISAHKGFTFYRPRGWKRRRERRKVTNLQVVLEAR